jgi:hypothetical protein
MLEKAAKKARDLARARVERGARERASWGTIESLAQGLLAECSRRLAERVEEGSLADCGTYPRLDLNAWGPAGRPAMIELVVDYGGAGRASVGVWARPCALWESKAPLAEKARAWRGSKRLAWEQGWDEIWDEALACALILSAKEMQARGPVSIFGKWSPEQSKARQDQSEWDAWVAAAGPGLEEVGAEMSEQGSPEWEAGGEQAKALVERIAQASRGKGA